MELSDYNLICVHIKGSNNILANAISRSKTLFIYRDPLENLKTSNTMNCIAEVVTTDIQTLGIDRLCTKQKEVINCRNLAAQSHYKNKNSFNSVMISPDGLLQKQYVHVLKYDVIKEPSSVLLVNVHEFHNSRGRHGTFHTFETIRRFY